jgi:hypothetical protein
MKMKISNFLKTHFFSIVFTFVDDFTFVALDDFLKQKLAFVDKN